MAAHLGRALGATSPKQGTRKLKATLTVLLTAWDPNITTPNTIRSEGFWCVVTQTTILHLCRIVPYALTLQAAMPSSAAEQEGYLHDTKEAQQELLKAISARLSKEVVANYQAFIDGMRQIGEIDLDVSRASIHVTNSLRKLGSARLSLVQGTLGIAYQRRRRERMADVTGRLRLVRSLFRVDEEVQVRPFDDEGGGCRCGQ